MGGGGVGWRGGEDWQGVPDVIRKVYELLCSESYCILIMFLFDYFFNRRTHSQLNQWVTQTGKSLCIGKRENITRFSQDTGTSTQSTKLSWCVCVYMCVCVYIHVCMYVCMYVCMCVLSCCCCTKLLCVCTKLLFLLCV